MPAGMAREFSRDVDAFVADARKEIVKVFESEQYAARRSTTLKKFQEMRDELSGRISENARKKGLLIQVTPMGLMAIPMVDDKPITEEEFRMLDAKTRRPSRGSRRGFRNSSRRRDARCPRSRRRPAT